MLVHLSFDSCTTFFSTLAQLTISPLYNQPPNNHVHRPIRSLAAIPSSTDPFHHGRLPRRPARSPLQQLPTRCRLLKHFRRRPPAGTLPDHDLLFDASSDDASAPGQDTDNVFFLHVEHAATTPAETASGRLRPEPSERGFVAERLPGTALRLWRLSSAQPSTIHAATAGSSPVSWSSGTCSSTRRHARTAPARAIWRAKVSGTKVLSRRRASTSDE